MSARETFLERVRQSVREGNRAGAIPPLPQRGNVGYQGADDRVRRFCTELTAAGGIAHVALDDETAWQNVLDLVRAHRARKVLVGSDSLLLRLDLAGKLRSAGLDVATVDSFTRDRFFDADVGITGVHRLIAETGTIVMATAPDEPRSPSLLPPVHIALAEQTQILPDLFDLFDLFASGSAHPSCLSLITGPSKTGDIELRLVTGVHGPGEVHVIIRAACGLA